MRMIMIQISIIYIVLHASLCDFTLNAHLSILNEIALFHAPAFHVPCRVANRIKAARAPASAAYIPAATTAIPQFPTNDLQAMTSLASQSVFHQEYPRLDILYT